MSALALAVRIARRELRSGLSGFRIFLAALTLGVAAIAGVGSLGEAGQKGLSQRSDAGDSGNAQGQSREKDAKPGKAASQFASRNPDRQRERTHFVRSSATIRPSFMRRIRSQRAARASSWVTRNR